MKFRPNSPLLEGRHAQLSASKPHWLNYDDDKLIDKYHRDNAAILGTRKHLLAHNLIDLGQKLPSTQQTLNMYVNDCIGYRMTTEQMLVFSPRSFGTADAIGFDDGVLRIFDLKTGEHVVKDTQLKIYSGFFCLEYKVSPRDISFDLRLYQNDDIAFSDTPSDEIEYVMERIVHADKVLKELEKETEW